MSGSSQRPTRDQARTILSIAIQRSIIELLAAYGVSIAPVQPKETRPWSRPADHVVGSLRVTAPNRSGTLTLSISAATLKRTRPEAIDLREQLDWVRELTNQLAGRIKGKLARYGVVLDASLPTALTGASADRSTATARSDLVLVFHTLREELVITLSGDFDTGDLSSQGDAPSLQEGDLLLF